MYLSVNPDTDQAPRAHQEGISHRSVTRERAVYTGHVAPARSIRGSGKQLERGSAERFSPRLEPWCRLGTGQENPIPQQRSLENIHLHLLEPGTARQRGKAR